ncbi:hypothetical protein U6A24_12640 [Aquimarina gracilis]|uniref:Uncharacterized protein n=1 Tax=Aquimarina gracilis TaxID=874422 RepID=A0ABU5ZWT2_9FLAO|nr:hypothetical protein [Aquimarina gracilis]MEB3346317.1 hypothetical protein [Aquimarina gracilis]
MVTFLTGYQTTVSSDTILETEDNYTLEGKIAPRFHNEGTTEVTILNVVVKPGEMFNCSATTFPMQGTINIIMPEGGKLVCIYNSLVKKEC